MWCGAGSNRRHKDFQSFALPTELPHQISKNQDSRSALSSGCLPFWDGKNKRLTPENENFFRLFNHTCPLSNASRHLYPFPYILFLVSCRYIPYSLKNFIRMIFSCSQLKLYSDNSSCATCKEEVSHPLKYSMISS